MALLANPRCLINFLAGNTLYLEREARSSPVTGVGTFWTPLRNDNDPCKRKRTL